MPNRAGRRIGELARLETGYAPHRFAFEAIKPFVDVLSEPRFRLLTVVDDVEANLALTLHHIGNRAVDGRIELGLVDMLSLGFRE